MPSAGNPVQPEPAALAGRQIARRQEVNYMSDYIMSLRKIVGHRTLLQCGASVIVENSKGDILLELRADNGCWGYAGGAVELDEPAEDAARRELQEETGLTALSLELFGVFSGVGTHCVYPNGDEVSNIDIVYICRHYTGSLRPQESEVSRLCFFPLDRLPANISPPIAEALRAYTDARLGKKTSRTGSSLAGCGAAHDDPKREYSV
jgi:ADP-ribose pyrophosphatase YjhB (NUDIX family)